MSRDGSERPAFQFLQHPSSAPPSIQFRHRAAGFQLNPYTILWSADENTAMAFDAVPQARLGFSFGPPPWVDSGQRLCVTLARRFFLLTTRSFARWDALNSDLGVSGLSFPINVTASPQELDSRSPDSAQGNVFALPNKNNACCQHGQNEVCLATQVRSLPNNLLIDAPLPFSPLKQPSYQLTHS